MQTPRRFLDFFINGESLHDRHGFDLISPLGWFVAEEDEHAARRLLGAEPPDLEGRVAIYVCAECGDLECGAITAIIEREGKNVLWRDLASTNFDALADDWTYDDDVFKSWRGFRFNAEEYLAALTNRPAPVEPSL